MFPSHSGMGDKVVNRDVYTLLVNTKHSHLANMAGRVDSSSAFPHVCRPSWIAYMSAVTFTSVSCMACLLWLLQVEKKNH